MFGGPVTKKGYGSNVGETEEPNSQEKKGIAHGRGGLWMVLTRRGRGRGSGRWPYGVSFRAGERRGWGQAWKERKKIHPEEAGRHK